MRMAGPSSLRNEISTSYVPEGLSSHDSAYGKRPQVTPGRGDTLRVGDVPRRRSYRTLTNPVVRVSKVEEVV